MDQPEQSLPLVATEARTESAPLLRGRLGNYELVRLLAQGGMADIYLARQVGIGQFERYVAVKVLNAQRAADAESCALFLDFDGTLVDLAPQPEAVIVPSELVNTLAALNNYLSGAIALISGRPIEQIDAFLHPLQLPAATDRSRSERPSKLRMRSSSAATASRWPSVETRPSRVRLAKR